MARLLYRDYNASYPPSVDNGKLVCKASSGKLVLESEFTIRFSSSAVFGNFGVAMSLYKKYETESGETKYRQEWSMEEQSCINSYSGYTTRLTSHWNEQGLGTTPKHLGFGDFLPTETPYTGIFGGSIEMYMPSWGVSNGLAEEGQWYIRGITINLVWPSPASSTTRGMLPPDYTIEATAVPMECLFVSTTRQHRFGSSSLVFVFDRFLNESQLYTMWGEYRNAVDSAVRTLEIRARVSTTQIK